MCVVSVGMKLTLLILSILGPVSGRQIERTFKATSMAKFENFLVFEHIAGSFVGLASVGRCHLQCLYDKRCQSFFYNDPQGFCQLNTRTLSEDSIWQASEHTKYYQITAKWCPSYSGYMYNKVADICYKFYSKKKVWSEARRVCLEEGGELIVLDTEKKYNQIVDFIRTLKGKVDSEIDFIIGASDAEKEGRWYWVNGKKLSVTSNLWAENEPNNQDNGQDHAIISARLDFKLDDEYDYRESYYFCEFNPN